jgi:hypothetical protein
MQSINPQEMKKLLLKERAFLQSYSLDQSMEEVVVGRLKKLGERIRV